MPNKLDHLSVFCYHYLQESASHNSVLVNSKSLYRPEKNILETPLIMYLFALKKFLVSLVFYDSALRGKFTKGLLNLCKWNKQKPCNSQRVKCTPNCAAKQVASTLFCYMHVCKLDNMDTCDAKLAPFYANEPHWKNSSIHKDQR